MSALLAFHFPIDATFEEVSAVVALHFGGEAVNLSTGEVTPAMRDAVAVFTGTSQLTVTTGANINTTEPAVEVDKNGLPWDERIHSSSKSKNADGTWRGRKGVPPQQITKVKAELLAGRQSGATAVNIAPGAGNGVTPIDGNTMTEDVRAARIAYAKEQAFAVAGAQPCSDSVFDSLQRGQLVTVDPSVSAWFDRWQSAMHAAFTAYGQPAAAEAQTAHMGMQAINPAVGTNQPVQIAAASVADTFATFAAHYAAHLANPAFGEVLATLGITGGFAALATAEPMIPAVKALLAAKGIV